MVPEGWALRKLSEVATVTSGGTPSKARPEYWEEGTIPWVRTTEVQNGILNRSDIPCRITELGLNNSSAKILPENTILMAMIGQGKTRGQVALLKEPASVNQNCAAIIINGVGYSDFYYQYFLSQYSNIRAMSNSAGQSNLSAVLIKEIRVPLPPLAEQKKIAKILSTWDEAIATTEQLLANSEQQKKALMQQLLTGKKRLPGFEGGWLSAKVGDVFRRVTTKNEGRSANVVTISGQQGLIRQQEFFNKSVASEILDGYFLISKGQFAYNKSYSKGYPMGAVKRLNRYSEAVVTTLYICFEIADEELASGDYFEHYFEAGLLNRGLSKVANEGGRAHGLLNVKPADFFSLSVSLPNLDEQKAIAKVLASAEGEVQELEKDVSLLQKQKKALMQQLLTGKRRVKVDEAERATA